MVLEYTMGIFPILKKNNNFLRLAWQKKNREYDVNVILLIQMPNRKYSKYPKKNIHMS